MQRHAQIETNREMLKRIVALLFSLAALADSVRGRPRHIRREVLQFLRPAEVVAWGIVLEDRYGLIASPDLIEATFSSYGNSAGDAAHLGVMLRALALTLLIRFALHCSFADELAGAMPATSYAGQLHQTIEPAVGSSSDHASALQPVPP